MASTCGGYYLKREESLFVSDDWPQFQQDLDHPDSAASHEEEDEYVYEPDDQITAGRDAFHGDAQHHASVKSEDDSGSESSGPSSMFGILDRDDGPRLATGGFRYHSHSPIPLHADEYRSICNLLHAAAGGGRASGPPSAADFCRLMRYAVDNQDCIYGGLGEQFRARYRRVYKDLLNDFVPHDYLVLEYVLRPALDILHTGGPEMEPDLCEAICRIAARDNQDDGDKGAAAAEGEDAKDAIIADQTVTPAGTDGATGVADDAVVEDDQQHQQQQEGALDEDAWKYGMRAISVTAVFWLILEIMLG